MRPPVPAVRILVAVFALVSAARPPDFRPANPFDRPITLRQLMTHRSGLVRESPVGNYFDPTGPSLADTVASLNRTKLVYRPQTRIKYSNAAVATVGYVLERTQKR